MEIEEETKKELKFSKYLKFLTHLLKIKNAKQYIHEIITKLQLTEPVYNFTEDNEYKWRCKVKINNTDICSEGYNNKKDEAKSNKNI